jgi:hypothetical protein
MASYLYVSDATNVHVFDLKRLKKWPMAQIRGLSNNAGLYVDHDGNLYVPQFNEGSGFVNVYAPRQTLPFEVLSNQGYYWEPFGPCGDRFGNVYVAGMAQPQPAMFQFSSGAQQASLLFYLSNADVSCAVDKGGDLFTVTLKYFSSTAWWIDENRYPVKGTVAKTIQSGESQTLEEIYIAFDDRDRLIVETQSTNGVSFAVYRRPYTGTPVHQFDATVAGQFAFDAVDGTLWVVGSASSIVELDYPSGRPTGRSITISHPILGLAIGG